MAEWTSSFRNSTTYFLALQILAIEVLVKAKPGCGYRVVSAREVGENYYHSD